MAVLAVWFVGGLVLLGLGVLTGLWWLGRPAHFVLAVLPLALLFFTQAAGPALWQMVVGFRDIAATGDSAPERVASLCLGVARPLWLAALAFVCTMTTAGILQKVLGRRRQPTTAIADGAARGPSAWGGWLLIVSSLLTVPVGVQIYATERIARVTMLVRGARPTEYDSIAAAFAGAGVPLGEAIGDQLKLLIPASTWLSHLLLAFGIANILVIGFRKAPDSLADYSSFVWGTLSIAGVGALLWLGSDIRWFAVGANQ